MLCKYNTKPDISVLQILNSWFRRPERAINEPMTYIGWQTQYMYGWACGRGPGLGWHWFLGVPLTNCFTWVAGSLAEWAMELGKMREHPNRNQPNPGPRQPAPQCGPESQNRVRPFMCVNWTEVHCTVLSVRNAATFRSHRWIRYRLQGPFPMLLLFKAFQNGWYIQRFSEKSYHYWVGSTLRIQSDDVSATDTCVFGTHATLT